MSVGAYLGWTVEYSLLNWQLPEYKLKDKMMQRVVVEPLCTSKQICWVNIKIIILVSYLKSKGLRLKFNQIKSLVPRKKSRAHWCIRHAQFIVTKQNYLFCLFTLHVCSLLFHIFIPEPLLALLSETFPTLPLQDLCTQLSEPISKKLMVRMQFFKQNFSSKSILNRQWYMQLSR